MNPVRIAKVRLLATPRATDREFDYLCPGLVAVAPGSVVKIPFGKGNRECYGVVTRVTEEASDLKLKEILSVSPPEVSLNAELMALCHHLQEQLLCSFGEAAKAILPSPVYRTASKKRRVIFPVEGLSPRDAVCSFRGKKKEQYLAALEYLLLCQGATEKVLRELFELDGSAVTLMEKKGWVTIFLEDEVRDASEYFAKGKKEEETTLSKEQSQAFQKLKKQFDTGKASAALLHGVTGSGKTRVMLKLCDHVLKSGRTVIFLVPEIALTGQSARLLTSYYGDRVALIHSGLSEGERRDSYVAIRRGEKPIVLGTRSAVFAPLDNLGLILIDEEQDQSYKSDTQLKYHARDVARFRCVQNNAMLLLSSATPDIESYYKAKSGVYSLVEMTHRYGSAVLPQVEIIDLRPDLRQDPSLLIGGKLRKEMAENLKRGEQTILLMNRRGYRRFVSCVACGEVIRCPHCSVSLTLHNGNQKKLSCHYCGYAIQMPEECPQCHEEKLSAHGYGIQQLEEEIHSLFPEAKVLRMDSDAITGKHTHEEILSAFRRKEAQILIGTQMVAKGHNFPDVTLVGIVMADSALYLSDYRAAEHAFSLLTQVIGRAGRAEKKGRALIQTLNPQHNVFALAAEQNFDEFYQGEIALRKAFLFPPFCRIAVFTLAAEKETELLQKAAFFSRCMEQNLQGEFSDVKWVVYGPFDAPIYRMKNIYRKRFIIKYKNNARSRALLNRLFQEAERDGTSVKITLDIGPGLI